MATPLTVCLLVVGKYVLQLSFLDILLGTEPVFEPKDRIYQRLLAGVQEEAAELFDDYLEDQPLVEVYDTALIPALASWDSQVDLHKAREHIGCGDIVVATLAEAREQIDLLIPPQLPHSERPAQPEGDPTVLSAAT